MLVESGLHLLERQVRQWQTESFEELCGGYSVFHGHRPAGLEDHWLTGAEQDQRREWIDGRGAFAAIERHAEAQWPSLTPRALKAGA